MLKAPNVVWEVPLRGFKGFEDHSGTDADKLASFEIAMRMLMLDILESAEQKALERPASLMQTSRRSWRLADAIDATEQELQTESR